MLKKFFLVSSLLVTSLSAQAGLISGTHATAGGKSVNLQGLEWMPITYTVGLSRDQVEDANGFIDRFSGTWKKNDWRYATRAETSLLLSSIHGGPSASQVDWDILNADGANTFVKLFGPTFGFDELSLSYFNYGERNECFSVEGYNFALCPFGYVGNNTVNGKQYGFVANEGGLNPTLPVNSLPYISSNDAHYAIGHLLVRAASAPATPVSAPSALSLFALGLCGLLLRRRKIAA